MPRPDEDTHCQLCGSAEFDARFEELPADFGLRLIGENRLAAAYEYLEQLVACGAESAEDCCRLGWLAFAFGDIRAVETWSHEALRLDNDMVEAHLLLAWVLQRSGWWAEAVEEYAAGLRRPGISTSRRARLEALLEITRSNVREY